MSATSTRPSRPPTEATATPASSAAWSGWRSPSCTCVDGLSWGDPRLGNVLIDEAGWVTALLDWDRASLGGPLVDLGWWLLFDGLHGEDYGYPRLPGLGGRAETIERWHELTGLRADNLEWYEIIAALRLAIVRFRGVKARELRGLWVPGPDNPRSWQSLTARIDSMIAAYEA